MIELRLILKLIDWTSLVVIKDKSTSKPILKCSVYELKELDMYKANFYRKVKMNRTNLLNTYVIYL